MPTISIIVPVYKVEFYLHRCIDSILAQTFTDFELILVDDGSPDNCGAICDEYAARDSRIHVIHQKNAGQSVARNTALDWVFANSKSTWISFIDSDDWVHPLYLEMLLWGTAQAGTSISMCSFLQTEENTESFLPLEKQFNVIPAMDALKPEDGSSGIDAYPWGKLFRNTLFENKRYPEGMIFEDFYLIPELFVGVDSVAYTSEKLYYYFMRSDSTVHLSGIKGVIDKYRGFEHQICIFRKKYPELAKETKRNCIFWLCNVYNSLIEANSNEAEIIRKLGKKFCLWHPLTIGFPLHPNVDILLAFLPKFSRIAIIASKIKRKFILR